jgi:quinol monooxygenase YgiN
VALEAAPALGRLAEAMQLATRAEPGCCHYAFGVDLARHERLWLSELWSDTEHLEQHFATPHMRAFRTAIRQLPGLVIEAVRYEAVNEKVFVAPASA